MKMQVKAQREQICGQTGDKGAGLRRCFWKDRAFIMTSWDSHLWSVDVGNNAQTTARRRRKLRKRHGGDGASMQDLDMNAERDPSETRDQILP